MTSQMKATEQYFHDLRFDIKGVGKSVEEYLQPVNHRHGGPFK